MSIEEMWDKLEGDYFTYEELQLCTSINGYTKETLNDMIYSRYGVRTIEDLLGDD